MAVDFKLIKRLVRLRTTESRPKEIGRALDVIAKHYKWRFVSRKYKFNDRRALVLANTRSKDLDLILAVHIDVVPAAAEDFKVSVDGDKLYGRGTADMKAAAVATIDAVREYCRTKNDKKIAVLITGDEEYDGLSIQKLLGEVGYKARFAIIPDGGNETSVVVRGKGSVQIELEVNGCSAHAMEPWKGINAIDRAMEIWGKIHEQYRMPHSAKDWITSVVLTRIRAGQNVGQIPGTAFISIDISYPRSEMRDEIVRNIRSIAGRSCRLRIISENPVFKVNRENRYLRALMKSIKRVTRTRANYTRDCGTSDAVFFMEKGIPSTLYGPNGANLHMDNEWVSKSSVETYYKVLLDFFARMPVVEKEHS